MRAVALLALLALSALLPAVPAAGTHAVSVISNAFVDSDTGRSLTIVPAGTTVTWTWLSGIHTVTRDAGTGAAFESGVRDAREDPTPTFSATFAETGVHLYSCKIHPGMRGQIVVE